MRGPSGLYRRALALALGVGSATSVQAGPMSLQAVVARFGELAVRNGPFAGKEVETLFGTRLVVSPCFAAPEFEGGPQQCLANAPLTTAEGPATLRFNWVGSELRPFIREELSVGMPASGCTTPQHVATILGRPVELHRGMPPTIWIPPGGTAPKPVPAPLLHEFRYSGFGRESGKEPQVQIALGISHGCATSITLIRTDAAQIAAWLRH